MASKITLADISHCDDGMMIVSEDAFDGAQRHISDVPSGLACNCICYGCRKRLVARKGDINVRAHSFAHMPDESPDCASSGESLLHRIAKDIIARHGRVTLPSTSVTDDEGKRHEVNAEQVVELRDVALEPWEGQIVPDIVAVLADGRRIFIEIANTHFCPPEKLAKLALMDVDVLEIDVSGYRDHGLDELDDIIVSFAPRRMIQSAAMTATANRLESERAEAEAERRARHEKLTAVYKDARNRNHKPAATVVAEMIELGLGDLMDMDDGLPSAFIVERRLWQAIVLLRIVKAARIGTIDIWDLMLVFRKRGWPKPELLSVKSEESRWITANVAAEFRSPYEEIRSYMKRLKDLDLVYPLDRSRFLATQTFRERLELARLPGSYRAELLEAFNDIGQRLTDVDGELPDFDTWLLARVTEVGESLNDFLLDEEGSCSDLLERLKSVYDQIDYPKDDVLPDDLVDLPLETLFYRLIVERGEAQERAEEEQERRRVDQAAERVTKIRSKLTAYPALDVVGVEWLETPLVEHAGKTPPELAESSPFGLERAETALNLEVWKRRSAAHAIEHAKALYQEFEGRVRGRFAREAEADAWLKQSWPQLGGVRVAVYCVDEEKRDRCLRLLDETAPLRRVGRP